MFSKKHALWVIDAAIIALAYTASFIICIESRHLSSYFPLLFQTLPIALFVKLPIFLFTGMYKPVWRYAGIHAAPLIIKSTVLASCLTVVAFFFFKLQIPRAILIVDGMLLFLMIGASRYAIRLLREHPNFMNFISGERSKGWTRKPVLIYGAGDAGEIILREARMNPGLRSYKIVGFIDDFKPTGRRIHDVPILGTVEDLSRIVPAHHVEELIIAISDLGSESMRKVVGQCRTLGVSFKVIPRIGDIMNGRITPQQLRDVDISDLLKRSPKNLDLQSMRNLISGRKILVSGAGGSIGTELCLQAAQLEPEEILLIDKSEQNLYFVQTKLQDRYPKIAVKAYLVSTTNTLRMERIFESKLPQIVFHAAAYKHVPICEDNVCESIVNNVQGAVTMADMAEKYGCEKFIYISTDKAVDPVGIMGATKRVGEIYIQGKNLGNSTTRFSTVRFGNVLESSGSVVPRFKEQIRKGGPVTVTHPEATRYLMLLEEAVQLILQAACMGQGGEVFVLDMGEPIKIANMARDLIALMGYRPDKDIPIQYSSLRPGEKLHERLYENDLAVQYAHPSILVGKPALNNWEDMKVMIDKLLWNAFQENIEEVVMTLKNILPHAGFTNPQEVRIKQ